MPTEEAWVDLVQRVSVVETFVSEMRSNHIPHINSELHWIKERLNRGYRPPWTVATLMALLCSAVVGLLVALTR